ncbi:638_t:CDS:2, partial [Scutellospora calospora]
MLKVGVDQKTWLKLEKLGSLVGSLPRYPLQNQLLGLPLSLMPEEEFEKKKSENESQQLHDYLRFIQEKRNKFKPLKKDSSSSDALEKDISHSNSEFQNHESSLIKTFAPTITIKTSSSSYEWYNDKDYCFSSLELARLAGLWTWPSTPKEEYKFKVYCDLWNRGYFITNGIKFGGDYLLYPGDPLRYHSHFIASIIDMDKSISPMDIITFGRLGTAVKKSYMLCSWNSNKNEA